MKNKILDLRDLSTISFIFTLILGISSFVYAGVGLDPSFGTGAGKNVTSFGGISDEAVVDVAIQADGKIVTVGSRNNNNDINTAIVRYRADGTLDTSFNGSGIIIYSFSTSADVANAVAIQTDGKILVGGYAFTSSYDFLLVRYNPDGTLDQTFGQGGIIITDINNDSRDVISDIVVQPDGKIVAVGYGGSTTGTTEMAFARFNSDGTFDTTFGTAGTGKIVTTFGFGDDYATEVALQADGKIVIGGISGSGAVTRLTLLRFNPDGTPDTSLDNDGILLYNGLPPSIFNVSLIIQPDNKIVAGMTTSPDVNNPNFSVLRFNSNGTNDLTFGTNGTSTIDAGNQNLSDELGDIILLPDGKILIGGGSVFPPFNKYFSLVRLNSDGSVDAGFGTGGRIFTTLTGIADAIFEMALQTDHKIVVGGVSVGGTSGRDFTIARYQPNGSLDNRFGEVGVVATPVRSGLDEVRDIAIQPDGKIVAGGFSRAGNLILDCALARYNPNGTLDTTFGSQGKVVISLHTGDDAIYAVAVQPDGKILATGYAGGEGGGDWAILRFNSNGTPDTTFDGDGRILVDLGGSTDVGREILVQPDGKILSAGYSFISLTGNFTVLRYNADGTPDTTFDGDGVATTTLNDRSGLARAMILQPDGKIVVAGDYLGPDPRDFAVVRFNPNGSLDTTFGTGGKVITPVGTSGDEVYDAALMADGRIVVVGFSASSSVQDFSVVRYNPDGSLDTTFDGDGKVMTPIADGSTDAAYSVALQPDGKIIAAGLSTNAFQSNFNFTLVRYNLDGSLDDTFGAGGKLVTDYGNLGETAYAVAFQNDGKIVIGGGINKNSTRQFALVRYSNLSKPVFDFDGDAKTDISVFRPPVGEWWINRSSSGQTVAAQFGLSSDKPVPADFTGDSKTDIAFWRSSTGEWFILRSEDASFLSFPFGAAGDVPMVGDFDGDSKADPTIFRPSTGEWFILRSTGGTVITTFGASGDVPVPSDYDGDGKTDVAIYRPSNGQWWIQRSSNGSVYAFEFGTSNDKPVQGDYTGDGKADAAFYRPATGEWFILRSEDSSFYSVPFGASGDLAAPGDYDGDGRFDTAVFRPSGANWFINQSTAGILITSFGAAGDQPVPNVFVP